MVKNKFKIPKLRLKLQNFSRILLSYLNFNAFFSKIQVESHENLSRKSGKVSKNFSA